MNVIDYQYQHAAHVVHWRMHVWMKANPRQAPLPRIDEDMEFDRNWTNFQNQLYYGWRKESV